MGHGAARGAARAREGLTDQEARAALARAHAATAAAARASRWGRHSSRCSAGVAEFDERGIVLRDLDRGLIDFPAIREGREVYLCWVDGESDIGFWHDLDAGFAGREAL